MLKERLCCLRHPFLAPHLLRWVGLSWLRFPLQYRPCLRGHRLGLHRQKFCPIVFRRKNAASGRFWGRGYCSKGHLSTKKKAVNFVHSDIGASLLECMWKESIDGSSLGHLWVAVWPEAFKIEAEEFRWPMRVTLVNADFVHKLTSDLRQWLVKQTKSQLRFYSFVTADNAELEFSHECRHSVIITLCVQDNMHTAFTWVRDVLRKQVWHARRSRCTFTELPRHTFHLSLD